MQDTATTPKRPLVLVIDDTPQNLSLMRDLLDAHYVVKLAPSGARGLEIAASTPPDLILLDIMMPDMDGYEVCRRLKAMPACEDVPVIFVTAIADTENEEKGLALGAVDYITKPISPPIVLARIRTHLQNKMARDFLKGKNSFLECEVNRRVAEVGMIQDVTIMAMASLAETRDNETGAHIRRTQHYVRRLAQALQSHPRFSADLTDEMIELLFKSAPLHDIGKVGIPDAILLKPGKLTDEEFTIMKTHTTLGRDAIVVAERHLDAPNSFLRYSREIAYSHQEKWDGSGYPQGLSGDAIPVSARLMALADVYDALISKRVYKPAFSHEKAVEIIVQGRGTHFDPDVVDAFIPIAERFRDVATHFSDEIEPRH